MIWKCVYALHTHIYILILHVFFLTSLGVTIMLILFINDVVWCVLHCVWYIGWRTRQTEELKHLKHSNLNITPILRTHLHS